ncbi:MAG: YncE family protein [Planctomycetota bacterium]
MLAAPVALCQADPPAAYDTLTNPSSSATNFNVETVRGLLLRNDGLYALNTHASRVVFHADLTTPGWEREFPTVHNPVAMAEWNGRLLVVGGSTWGLAEHDFQTGRLLRYVELPAEPADIVVDAANDEAYVACQGANVVARIDLVQFTENARYPIPSQRPRFLFFDEQAVPPMVYVAPFLSGNNTTLDVRVGPPVFPMADMNAQRSKVVDLDTVPNSDLPDEDLFRIDPSLPVASAVTPVLHGAGTLLVEHGRNPATGDYWIVSTESHNAAHNSEDLHRGVFASAQLAIASTLGGPGRPTPSSLVDLDVPVGGGQKGVNTTMSSPFAMAFHSSGLAAIASSTSDLITFVDAAGVRLFDLPITQQTHPTQPAMPPQIGRAIPRDLVWHEPSSTLTVYCWGWNKALVYNLDQLAVAPFWLDLGPDPQPIAVQQGRSIFYDAKRPVDVDAQGQPFPGAVTCSTCHPAGGMDLLAWALSDSMKDIKDLMVTQSLLSISDTFPYHWRGERNLDHFNGAFEGLLGFQTPLDETPGGELDQFEAFVFSLQAPANPIQSPKRELSTLEARQGQDVFLNQDDVLFGFTCNECHRLPSGTNGENIAEVFVNIASTGILDVAHLRQMQHKDQTMVNVTVPLGDGSGFVTVPRARGGFGISHNGTNFDIEDFLTPGINGGPFNITVAQQQQLTAFMREMDQGIAPAAHRSYRIDAGNVGSVAGTVRTILLDQAQKGWISVAVIGSEDRAGQPVDLAWAYDPVTQLFVCSNPGVGSRTWTQFVAAITGNANYLFVGLPPQNARRFALDPDDDDLTDAQELAQVPATDPRDRDSDDDGFDDGYEVSVSSPPTIANVPVDNTPPQLRAGTNFVQDHSMATFAKYFAEFTEPVTWTLEALDMNQQPPTVVSITRSTALQRIATVHMHELISSTPAPGDTRNYAPRLTITDQAGNPTTIVGGTFAAVEQFVVPPRFVVQIGDLSLQSPIARTQTSIALNVDVNVKFKVELNGTIDTPDRVVVAHVLKRPQGTDTWTVSSLPDVTGSQLVPGFDTRFQDGQGVVTINPYTALPGDFLLSTLTDANGNASFSFAHHNLQPGDEVRLSIVAVLEPSPSPLVNTFELVSIFDWDLPRTPSGPSPTVPTAKDLRGLTVTF